MRSRLHSKINNNIFKGDSRVKRILSVFITSMFLASAAFAADATKDEKKTEPAKADAKAKASDTKGEAKSTEKKADGKAKASGAKADAKSDEKKAATK
jgi:hypothetical protein